MGSAVRMRLQDCLPDETRLIAPHDVGAARVAGITAASGDVKSGYIFAAMPGTKVDGITFAPDAIARGAIAVLIGEGKAASLAAGTPAIEAKNPRRALALIAAKLAGAQPVISVAVTGTSGKTSVADFTRQLFTHAGRAAASLGTIGVIKPSGAVYGSLTTPDPVTLHQTLAGLANEGVTHLAFEASSHGLDQHRLDGVRLTAAAFTNLGRDHLDYHPSIDAYFDAKMRLFRELLPDDGSVVINADGAYADRVIDVARARKLRVLTVGAKGDDLKLLGCERDGFKQRLSIQAGRPIYNVPLSLVGAYQVENALTAAGLAIAAGAHVGQTLLALEYLRGVPGRLDIVGEADGALAVVDYAHKPEALEAALAACRPFATNRLICVFGCGGDRDRGKRPIMGKIAVEHADVVIVTDDNPRTEQPSAIRAEILAGANGAMEIGDRAEAISAAVRMMQPGDVVLVAGKGHETGQIVGTTTLPFSDHDELRNALAAREGAA